MHVETLQIAATQCDRRVSGGRVSGATAPELAPEMGTQPNTPRDVGYEFVYSGCRIYVVLSLETRRQWGSVKIKERLLRWRRSGGGAKRTKKKK